MNSFRVLFVDDEEELVSTLVERLGYRGIEADYAINGENGLEKLQHEIYDVVIVDLKLPGLSGEELIRIINTSYPKLPIIMITGHGSTKDDDNSHRHGVSAFLQKPMDISVLIEKMRDVIEANESE